METTVRIFIPGEATDISHCIIHSINLKFYIFSPDTVLDSINTEIRHIVAYYNKPKV